MAGMEISTAGLGCSFGRKETEIKALDSVDLRIAPGEAVAIVGRSGSGKSTLLHVLGGMLRPTAGTVTAGGVQLDTVTPSDACRFRQRVGFVFQRFHLLPMLSAEDNVALPAIPLRAGRELRIEARQLLAEVGLEGRERALPAHLSGGEQQRVAVARALISNPELVLADEPTGNLDTATGDRVVSLLERLRASFGFTFLVATHDRDVAERLDRTIHLEDGRIAPPP